MIPVSRALRATLALLALHGGSGAPLCSPPTVAWMPGHSLINASTAPGNAHGLEDGLVVRRADGALTMIAAAMYGDPLWVRMRLDVFGSADGTAWQFRRSLRVSDANFDGSSQHSSSWGPFLTLDSANNSWLLSYVGYRGAPSNASGWLENFRGTIFARSAAEPGDAGLDSDFDDANFVARDVVLLEPDDFSVTGPWPHACQGLQGTDSMFPFPLAADAGVGGGVGGWAAFVGTSHQETPNPWPQPGGGKWPVSLATAPALTGPWTRLNAADPAAPADAPCVDLNGGFSENPIVSRRRVGNVSLYQVVHDDLNAEADGFGYGCSLDGVQWPPTALVPLPGGCRTPFGLVPMTPAEVAVHTPAILAWGAVNATQLNASGSSLSWLFYTAYPPGGAPAPAGGEGGGRRSRRRGAGAAFEAFFAAIVYFAAE